MKLERGQPGDVVRWAIKGRTGIDGEVTEIKDGIVYFRALCPATGWRHVTACEVVGHWRKAGRRGGEDNGAPGATQAGLPAGGLHMTGRRAPRGHVAGLGSCHGGGGVSVPPAAAIEPSTAAEGLPGRKSSRPPGGRRVVRRCEPLAEAAATVPSSETGGSAPASTGDTSPLQEQRGVRELVLAVLSAGDKQLLLEGGMSRASPTPAGTTRRRTPRREVLDDASRRDRATRSLRFAYADPPYPGKADIYPEREEVDHAELAAPAWVVRETPWQCAWRCGRCMTRGWIGAGILMLAGDSDNGWRPWTRVATCHRD